MPDLGHPPEFGASGQAPAVQSPTVLDAEDFYFGSKPRAWDGSISPVELLRQRRNDELSSDLVTAKRWLDQRALPRVRQGRLAIAGAIGSSSAAGGAAALGVAAAAAVLAPLVGVVVGAGAAGYLLNKRRKQRQPGHGALTADVPEVRRVQVHKRWVRDDPISQLAPGSNSSKTVEVTVGLSQQTTRELATHLGVGQLTAIALSGQVSAKVVSALTVNSEEKHSHTVTLDNTGNDDRYRRFAIWHVENTLQIDVLHSSDGLLSWRPLAVASYVPSATAAILTSTDIPIQR